MLKQNLTARAASWLIAGALIAGSGAVANAADLSGEYDHDPRYAELFGDSKHNGYSYDDRRERYAERRHKYPDPAYEPEAEYRHAPPKYDRGDYERHAPRYGARRYSDYAGDCLPRRVIIRRLLRKGWRAFTPVRLNRRVAVVEADNSNGDRYRLRVNRCSGHIIRKRAIYARNYDRGYDRFAGRRRYNY
ncbi:MAG: hypothetical protein AAFU50_03015 [Pseudomonadota bacterium]